MSKINKNIDKLLSCLPNYKKNSYIYKILFYLLCILVISIFCNCVLYSKELFILHNNNKSNNNNNNNNKSNDTNSNDKNNKNIEIMKRPFLNIYDDKGKAINVVFVTHPFSRDECIEQYNKAIQNNVNFLGMSSYCEFPGLISNPHDVLSDPKHKAWTYDYFKLCKGWCHCFRDPRVYIPDNHPKILLSESDFAKYKKHIPDPNVKKEYDFLYVVFKR